MTKTEKIARLSEQGYGPKAIAAMLKTTPNTVNVLLYYRRHPDKRRINSVNYGKKYFNINAHLLKEDVELLKLEAARREMKLGTLVRTIIQTVLEDNMFAALLDD